MGGPLWVSALTCTYTCKPLKIKGLAGVPIFGAPCPSLSLPCNVSEVMHNLVSHPVNPGKMVTKSVTLTRRCPSVSEVMQWQRYCSSTVSYGTTGRQGGTEGPQGERGRARAAGARKGPPARLGPTLTTE